MKITTQQQLDDLIATANKSNTIVLDEDLEITFDCKIPCNIKAHGNITACNIDACNIDAFDIDAHGNITACNIDAFDITACIIDAHGNITACNITACIIKAKNIEYYAFCIAYKSLKCESIAGARKNSFHKCLDQEIEITKEIKL